MPSIAVFAYNRPDHLRQTVESLARNKLSTSFPLFIFIDGPRNEEDLKNINKIKDYCKTISGFKEINVISHSENQGLAKSIINGINYVFEHSSRVIVFEDDIIAHPDTLDYFLKALKKYENNKKVFSISANSQTPNKFKTVKNYDFDVFFTKRMMCWGWATWRDRWSLCNWSKEPVINLLGNRDQCNDYAGVVGEDSLNRLKMWSRDKIDVWACRWVFEHYKQDAFCVVPFKTMTMNIGRDGTGTHCKNFENKDGNNFGHISYDKLPELSDYNKSIDIKFVKLFKKPYRNLIFSYLRNLHIILIKKWDNFLFKVYENKMDFFGTEYGGWKLPANCLDHDSNILSIGAGEDISFDTELIKKYGCKIHIFDPTPRAKIHYENTRKLLQENQKAPINYSKSEFYDIDIIQFNKIKFYEIGIWQEDRDMKFFQPKNKKHVSHSITNMHNTDEYFLAKCLGYKSICDLLSFEKIDLLKMDIEGAEYAVLRNIMQQEIKPELLLVEFHLGKSIIEKIFKIHLAVFITMVLGKNYTLLSKDKFNFVFQRK